MSNTTIITGSNSSISHNHSQGNVSTHGLNADTANNLGYGLGSAIKMAFDSLWNTWHKMWISEPSTIEIAEQRHYLIYKGGLRECVKILGPALANLQMNPRDSNALKKVEQLAEHFARYLKPSDEKNLRQLQNEILKPLEERVSAIAFPNMKNVLRKRMAIFFQGNNLMSENEQIVPTLAPTNTPTHVPTSLPSDSPTIVPTVTPTHSPTRLSPSLPTTPTEAPTEAVKATGLIIFVSIVFVAALIAVAVGIYRLKKKEKEEEGPTESAKLFINTNT